MLRNALPHIYFPESRSHPAAYPEGQTVGLSVGY